MGNVFGRTIDSAWGFSWQGLRDNRHGEWWAFWPDAADRRHYGLRPCLPPAAPRDFIGRYAAPRRRNHCGGGALSGRPGTFNLGTPQPPTGADARAPFCDGGCPTGRCRHPFQRCDLLPGCRPFAPRQRAAPGAAACFCGGFKNEGAAGEARLFAVHSSYALTGPPPAAIIPTCVAGLGAQPEQPLNQREPLGPLAAAGDRTRAAIVRISQAALIGSPRQAIWASSRSRPSHLQVALDPTQFGASGGGHPAVPPAQAVEVNPEIGTSAADVFGAQQPSGS